MKFYIIIGLKINSKFTLNFGYHLGDNKHYQCLVHQHKVVLNIRDLLISICIIKTYRDDDCMLKNVASIYCDYCVFNIKYVHTIKIK